MWYNGVPALQFPASVLRTTDGIGGVTGMFFSTFFGGDDSTWATPTQQYIYFRNIAMYAGNGQSTASGASAPTGALSTSSGAAGRLAPGAAWTRMGTPAVLAGAIGLIGLSVGVGKVGVW